MRKPHSQDFELRGADRDSTLYGEAARLILAPDLCILVMVALDGGKSHIANGAFRARCKMSSSHGAAFVLRGASNNLLHILSVLVSGGVNSSEHPVVPLA